MFPHKLDPDHILKITVFGFNLTEKARSRSNPLKKCVSGYELWGKWRSNFVLKNRDLQFSGTHNFWTANPDPMAWKQLRSGSTMLLDQDTDPETTQKCEGGSELWEKWGSEFSFFFSDPSFSGIEIFEMANKNTDPDPEDWLTWHAPWSCPNPSPSSSSFTLHWFIKDHGYTTQP